MVLAPGQQNAFSCLELLAQVGMCVVVPGGEEGGKSSGSRDLSLLELTAQVWQVWVEIGRAEG